MTASTPRCQQCGNPANYYMHDPADDLFDHRAALGPMGPEMYLLRDIDSLKADVARLQAEVRRLTDELADEELRAVEAEKGEAAAEAEVRRLEGERATLCKDGQHRWDAQVALRKGGVEDGDPCSCGAARFGGARDEVARLRGELEEFRRKYHEAMDVLTAWDKIDHAEAVARMQAAEARATQAEQELAAARAVVDALWTEFHFYDDHREDGFGDTRETCQEGTCVRLRRFLQEGQSFVPDAAALARLSAEQRRGGE